MSADSRRVRELIYFRNGVAALAVSACLLAALDADLCGLRALGRGLIPSGAGARITCELRP